MRWLARAVEVVAGLVVEAAVVVGAAVVRGAVVVVEAAVEVVAGLVVVEAAVVAGAAVVRGAVVVLGAAVVVGVVAVVPAAAVTGEAVVAGAAPVVGVTGLELVGAVVTGTTASKINGSVQLPQHRERAVKCKQGCLWSRNAEVLVQNSGIFSTQRMQSHARPPCTLHGHAQRGCKLKTIQRPARCLLDRACMEIRKDCCQSSTCMTIVQGQIVGGQCNGAASGTCSLANVCQQALLDLAHCINERANCNQQISLWVKHQAASDMMQGMLRRSCKQCNVGCKVCVRDS